MKISERQLRRLINEEVSTYKRGTISEIGFLKRLFGRGEDWPPKVNMPKSDNLEEFGGLTSIKNNGTIIDLAIKRNLITRQQTLMSDDKTRTPKMALEKYNEAIKAMTTQIEGLIDKKLTSGGEFSFAGKLSKDLIYSTLGAEDLVVRNAISPASVKELLNKAFPEGNSLGQKIYAYAIFRLVDSIANNSDAFERMKAKDTAKAEQHYATGLDQSRGYCKDSLNKGDLAQIFGGEPLNNPFDVKNMLFSHLDGLDYKAVQAGIKPIIGGVLESAATKKDQLIFERWQQMAGLLRG